MRSLVYGPNLFIKVALGEISNPKQIDFRDFTDTTKTRQYVYDSVLDEINKLEPISNDRYTLQLKNAQYQDPDTWSKRDQKKALLTGETIGRRVRGTWELLDPTGKMLEAKTQVVARVPYMSDRGTFINNGNEYTLRNQQRLKPGIYTRMKENGEIESHVNVMAGNGVGHHYHLDPAKQQFTMRIQQASIPLLPLLKTMGVTDRQLQQAWGSEIYAANATMNSEAAIRKIAEKVLSTKDFREGSDNASLSKRVAERFRSMQIDPFVSQKTLGQGFSALDQDTILAATKKLIAVNRGEAETDDRDQTAFQTFHGPEELFAERIRKDHGRIRRGVFNKVSALGNLSKMPSGVLTEQLEQLLIGSGLAQNLEEINMSELLDKQTSVTRMGEGGIGSTDAIPDEARMVHPSQFGIIDPIRTPESLRAGVDLYLARNAFKGRDGKLYAKFNDVKTGQQVWKTPEELSDLTIAFPDSFKWPTKRIPVMQGGKINYAPRNSVDVQLGSGEDAFSPLSDLIPGKSALKAHRVAMGSRMLTQALPLKGAQAPLVQGALPGSKGTRSFEEELGSKMGAVFADQDGEVLNVDPEAGSVRVQYADGKQDDIELYQNFPFNRKTALHQTPLVKPGDRFTKGQPIIRSNYTDENGTTALGLNLRVAYMPWQGKSFEDANVISESAAKRFTSEHIYQHGLELDDKTRFGKNSFINLFPQKFDRKTLDNLDENGMIRPGTEVRYGDPLILAARENVSAQNKIHRKKQAGFTDQTITWDHHDPGVVTDVVMGKNGPTVVVKSESQAQIGDKLSGRVGDKGVIAAIIPDEQMPKDGEGRPFEMLVNPMGLQSRTNPIQMIEAWLGKIAEKTGQPYRIQDFEDIEDLTEFAKQELTKNGLGDTEDVYLPEGGKLGGVGTGTRFFMKLHHTAESKLQGRGSAAYSSEETPAKGGETGCFAYHTELQTEKKAVTIGEIVEDKLDVEVLSYDLKKKEKVFKSVTNRFMYDADIKSLIVIELENGSSLLVTKNHKMYLKDGTMKLAGNLTEDDELLGADE